MSRLEQAKTIIGAISASLKNKSIITDEETAQKRLAICESCEYLTVKERRSIAYWYCAVCGCGYRKKIALSGSKCPQGKW